MSDDDEKKSVIDRQTLATGAVIAVVSTLIALFAADQVRSAEIDQLGAKLEEVNDKLDDVAKQGDVRASEDRMLRRAKSYTDRQVSMLSPGLAEQRALLQRLDEDRKEAKADRRQMDDKITKIATAITELKTQRSE